MASQQTFVMVKPDGVRRRLVGEVIRRIEVKGYNIREMKLITVDESLAKKHYAEHVDKPFFAWYNPARMHITTVRHLRPLRGYGRRRRGCRRGAAPDHGRDEPARRDARIDTR